MKRANWVGVVAALLAVGCSGSSDSVDPTSTDPEPTGAEVATDAEFPEEGVALNGRRKLGPPLVVGSLTVWPVHDPAPVDLGDFRTLEEAQALGLAKLQEVGSTRPQMIPGQANPAPGGQVVVQTEDGEQVQAAQVFNGRTPANGDSATVGTLELENTGDKPILVLAGTVVKGGKQDRQIGQDFVVAARSKVPVDAFCVERGRWNQTREGKQTGNVFVAKQVLANKSVRLNAQYMSDQGKVWEEVGKANHALGNGNSTSTFMATVEEDDAEAVAYRESVAKQVAEHFTKAGSDDPRGALVGYAYAIDGELVGVRAFAHPRVFDKQWDTCRQTIALETDLARRQHQAQGDTPQPRAAPAAKVQEFVDGIRAAKAKQRKAGDNRNIIRQTDAGGNAACEVQAEDGSWQKLTEDWTKF